MYRTHVATIQFVTDRRTDRQTDDSIIITIMPINPTVCVQQYDRLKTIIFSVDYNMEMLTMISSRVISVFISFFRRIWI